MASFLADPFFPSALPRPHAFSMPPSKLPSLEGLLKRLHAGDLSDASTDDESCASSSCASSPSRMPSLRSILSPALLAPAAPWDESASDASSEYEYAPVSEATPKKSGPQRSRASKYCKIEGCERVSQRNNLCHSHGGKRLCKEDGCVSKDRGNGFCIKHGGGKICSIGGCDKKARRKGLCTQHFRVCDSLTLGAAPY